MTGTGFPPTAQSGAAPTLRALAVAYQELACDSDPAHALGGLVSSLRKALPIDRVGIFAYDAHARILDRVAGIDQDGRPEFAGEQIPLRDHDSPLMHVASGRLSYYLSDDAPRDYPVCSFAAGVRALAIIPINAGSAFLGVLCADNCLTGRGMPPDLLEPLFLYAGLASIPLFSLYQQKERERTEAMREEIHREVLFSVTSGKIRLCNQEEIHSEWPSLAADAITISRGEDVRRVREAALEEARICGMADERARDFGLCASEAATNALLHGNGGTARVASHEGRLRIRVEDYGEGIDPHDLPRATLLKGWSKRASLGLGFTIMNETSDRLYLHTGRDGTTLVLEMAVEANANLPNEANPLFWGEPLVLEADPLGA